MSNNKFDSIYDALDEYLLSRHQHVIDQRGYDYWSASSLGKCMRHQVLNRAGIVLPRGPINNKAMNWKNNAEDGTLMHHWRQLALNRMGILVKDEGELIDNEFNYRGHFDAVVKLWDKALQAFYLTMGDIKTQNNRAYMALARPQIVDPNHRRQVISYWHFARKQKYSDLRDARIFYVNRNTGDRRECVISQDSCITAVPDILDELKGLNEAWDGGLLPKKQKSYFCNLCRYNKLCDDLRNSKNTKIKDAVQRSLPEKTESAAEAV